MSFSSLCKKGYSLGQVKSLRVSCSCVLFSSEQSKQQRTMDQKQKMARFYVASITGLLLLSWILSVVAFGAPWIVVTNISNTSSYSLTSYTIGSATTAYTPALPWAAMGQATLAMFVLAFLTGLVAFVGSCVELASSLGRPIAAAPPSTPVITQVCAWVSFACALCGLAIGVSFVALIIPASYLTSAPTGLTITFPARGAAAAAFVFSLLAAILQTVYLKHCCGCCKSAGAGQAPVVVTIAPTYGAPKVEGPPASLWRVVVGEGNERWYENCVSRETAWDLPPGGKIVA